MKKENLSIHDQKTLKKLLEEKQTQLSQMRFNLANRSLRQVHKVGVLRKEIARIKTHLNK